MALITGDLALKIVASLPEHKTAIGAEAKQSTYPHGVTFDERYINGTGSNKQDCVYSARPALSTSPTDLDLRGSLTSVLDGSVVSFPIITTLIVRNLSSTAGESVTIGAGSNPFITWLIATGDGIKVGPGGIWVLHSPIDGYATAAGTADIFRLVAATGTPSVDIFIAGRSA